MDRQELFIQFLESRKLRNTAGRRAILREIDAFGQSHFSAEDLVARFRRRGIAVSRATVYRTLEHLVVGGLVRRLSLGHKHALFEGSLGRRHHEHLICLRCGKVTEFASPALERLLKRVCRRRRFAAQRRSIQLFGICPRCAEGDVKGEPSPARVLRWLGALLAALLATLAVPVPAVAGPATSRVVRARYLMGTIFRLEVPAEGDPSAAADSLEAALDEVQRLEEVLSNWRSDSELSRLNARAGQGAIQVSTDLFGAVESSLHWARETGGAFDPTVEPLTRRNRAGAFGTGPSSENPSGAARIRAAWRRVDLDPVSRSVAIPPGGGLDLGGIGKGIALDRAAHVLLTRGIRDALLDAGGQLLALGSPPGEEGWEVGVADPEERHRPGMVLVLRDVSVATSGNSQRPGEIVDPSTGAAVEGRYSATALARDATSADALSTALFVMAPDRGEAWASHRDDLLALYLEPAGKIGGVPRGRGTLVPPPRGRTLLITARSGQSPGSLHAEIR